MPPPSLGLEETPPYLGRGLLYTAFSLTLVLGRWPPSARSTVQRFDIPLSRAPPGEYPPVVAISPETKKFSRNMVL